jgi:hypothetical protein
MRLECIEVAIIVQERAPLMMHRVAIAVSIVLRVVIPSARSRR